MQPIKLYFAGAWGVKKEQGDLDIKNRLVSFLYKDQLPKWLQVSEKRKGRVIIDSGAFSAWNNGAVISLDEYIQYAHNSISLCSENNKKVRIVNLDVIPGKVGETSALNSFLGNKKHLKQNKKIINSAAKQGFSNLKIMKQNGIIPIHVFHQGEDFKWLDKMIEQTDYIGISPANDMPTYSKKKWMYSVFEYLYKHDAKVDTHGFAVMIPELLKQLPWTSCDAISWRMIAATGSVIYPTNGLKHPKFRNSKHPYNQITVSANLVGKGAGGITPHLLQCFEKDGYSYEDLQKHTTRYEINVKTYHLYEKWINKFKKKTAYTVKSKLF